MYYFIHHICLRSGDNKSVLDKQGYFCSRDGSWINNGKKVWSMNELELIMNADDLSVAVYEIMNK